MRWCVVVRAAEIAGAGSEGWEGEGIECGYLESPCGYVGWKVQDGAWVCAGKVVVGSR